MIVFEYFHFGEIKHAKNNNQIIDIKCHGYPYHEQQSKQIKLFEWLIFWYEEIIGVKTHVGVCFFIIAVEYARAVDQRKNLNK